MRVALLALALSASPQARVEVVVDVSEAADLAAWMAQAKAVCEEWYPRIAERLASEGYTPPAKVSLVAKKDLKIPGAASGARIEVGAAWIRKHPDDVGMVVHELVHVVQRYPSYEPGWLTEGIADWLRYYVFEPEKPKRKIDRTKASYKDAYATTAAFLDWIQRTHDKDAVRKLNAAMRATAYRPELWREMTGKDLDPLWADFLKSL